MQDSAAPIITPTEVEAMRVLNVAIPASAYWHIRQCATESRMSLKQFMAAFCQTAKPIVTAPATAEGPQ